MFKTLFMNHFYTLLFLCFLISACDLDPDFTPSVDVAATCIDGIQNGDEAGVDCGGTNCPTCPTCVDGIQNGDETGVDCGGSCQPCGTAPTCTDGIQNGDETGVDCGGTISNCPPCAILGCTDSDAHNYNPAADTDDGSCETCNDNVQNGDETEIDCGGVKCNPCVNTFELVLGGTSDENLYSVIETDNGNFLAVGSTNINGDLNTWFLSSNADGTNTNDIRMGAFRDNCGKQIVEYNSNFLIISSGGDQGVFVQEVTENGTGLGTSDYGSNEFEGNSIVNYGGQTVLCGIGSEEVLIQFYNSSSKAEYQINNAEIGHINSDGGNIVVTGIQSEYAFFARLSNQGPGVETLIEFNEGDAHEDTLYTYFCLLSLSEGLLNIIL